jgi:succinate-semialdehyde dehydrogenase/glutarate-semialdehyde dehydrogenase
VSPDALIKSLPTGCFIDGQWRPSASGAVFPVLDPATGETLCEVADAGGEDALAALTSAAGAQASWAATPPRDRSDILLRAWSAVLDRIEDFALVITLEMGKPLAEARGEVRYAADFLRWFSEQAVRVSGEYRVSPDGASRMITVRQPVGPSLLIAPWNFPLAMITRKVGPALAAGCTTIIKPAEDTPLSSLLLAQVLAEAGVPAGVVNVIPTSAPAGVSEPLLADRRLRKLSFTGSTPVGQRLLAAAAPGVLRTSMELGGNSPFLVFADADLDAAVDGVMLAKMRNGGESCVAANRILVHEDVRADFARRLAERMSSLRVGPGTDDRSELGPMINRRQLDRVAGLVQDAVAAGAQVLTGGGTRPGDGYFMDPTVLTDVPARARMRSEEIFGPVAPIYTFTTDAEAVAMANDSPFGLVAYLYTRDVSRAQRVGEALEAGMVGINRGLVSNAAAPFGGIKQSGLGREGGFEGIDEYLETKYMALDVA